MKTKGLVVAALVALCFIGFATNARAESGDMRLRLGVLSSMPTDDLVAMGQTTEADDAFGFQVGFEYWITDTIGVEPAISSADHELTVIESGFPDLELGDIDFFGLTASLNFHLTPEKKFDFYAGPTVGYLFWGDLESDMLAQDFPADDEFVYGFNVGFDVPFGEGNWGFTGAFGYLFSEITLEGSSADIGMDPMQLRAGVSYSF